MESQYSDDFVERLHLIWGAGFLSPGGPEEVALIVEGLDLADRHLLDIGCGTGGPAVVLARERRARLTCIDVEAPVIERARRLASVAGVAERIQFRLVEPGPLPFADGSFDLVFSKDSLIHIADKPALYAEILRVLTPGGIFAASDWLCGADAAENAALQRFIEAAHLSFAMATAEETAAVMRDAGFQEVGTNDRNAWYADYVAQEVAAIEGPLRAQIIAAADEETYDRWLGVRRLLAAATASGGLRPTHLRGRRPAA